MLKKLGKWLDDLDLFFSAHGFQLLMFGCVLLIITFTILFF